MGIIDGKTFPKVPVIVINLNERSDINGDIDPRYDKNTNLDNSLSQTITKPKKTSKSLDPYEVYPPDDVAGQYLNSYNMISWSYPAEYGYNDYIQVEKEVSGYWELVYETFAINGSDTYFDNDSIVPGYQYIYRLRTKRINPDFSEMYSYYSPTIIVDVVNVGLAAPTNSTINAYGPNEIHLTWVYPTNINISGFKIQARKMGNGDLPFDIATLAAGSRSYTDFATKELGAKYQYSIRAYNGSTNSGPLEDIVYNPYRTYTEHLYLTNIYFYNITEFEYWYLGTPEVKVSLAHLPTPSSTQPIIIYREEFITVFEEIIPRSYDYPQAQYGFNLDALSGGNWDNYFYHQVLSFTFIEYHAPNWLEGWKGLSFSTKIPIKIGTVDIQAASSIDLNFSIRNRTENLGSTYVAYWFPEDYSAQVLDNIIVTFSTQPPY
ncbi:MAG: fibronectin type III domain-containing protein [Bacteroidales bacterium]|nr:fibronectin type III domain-containing protein [Bacteroidales bacterium]